MKKFLQIFLICQMLVCSFIYTQSIYDIYTLNNLGADNLNTYYLENPSGENLGNVYDSLTDRNAVVELIKEPVTNEDIMLYEIYDTPNAYVNKKMAITDEKQFSYYTLSKNDFVDSTGKFKTNLKNNEIKDIANKLNISINQTKNDNISYSQVINNNKLNLIVLLLLSQFVLFIYTLLRIKVNAVKKLLGFSNRKIILDSYSEFIKFELFSIIITMAVHTGYCAIKGVLNTNYILGLIAVELVVSVINLLLLLFTVVSVKSIDISSIIKNKLFSNSLSTFVMVAKVCFVVAISLSISIFANQYNKYNKTVENINEYKSLAKYYTSNGYNSDEYDKIFCHQDSIEQVSSDMKKMYKNYSDKLLLVDVNATNCMSENYYEVYGTTFDDLLNSYSDNYAVLNKRYLTSFVELYDEFGNKLDYDSLSKGTILVPECYKNNGKVNDFCEETYNDMVNYDSFYTDTSISDKQLNTNIIYIKDNQSLNVLSKYQLNDNESIKNTIIFLDSGEFAGTWYLDSISNGNISISLNDREEFSSILEKYNLDSLLNAGTLLTPLTEEIRYYEFTTYQTLVFAVLFSVTLLFIVYLSNYLEIMTNRKGLAIKRLMGFSSIKSLLSQFVSDFAIILIVIIMYALNINAVAALLCILLDVFFLNTLYRKIIVKDVSGNLKGE
nr:hypothetical protein [uncultured Ruminococcus sp.]